MQIVQKYWNVIFKEWMSYCRCPVEQLSHEICVYLIITLLHCVVCYHVCLCIIATSVILPYSKYTEICIFIIVEQMELYLQMTER